jgi:hypothetical protein
MNYSKFVKAIVVASSLMAVQAANAALVDCTASSATGANSKVKNTTGTATAVNACQYITPADPSNTATVANINSAGFFGTTSWAANGGNVQINPSNDQAGTWTIAGADFATFDYMIVFKDGANTNLIGFLFNELFSTGSWTTPFTNPPFTGVGANQSKDVSDFTIVQRRGGTGNPGGGEAPEPGILALMGLGMAGFLAARRRSAKK